jgi:catechol 2,3-dioxygenase-like lactoylglutathione lyase family enzyme
MPDVVLWWEKHLVATLQPRSGRRGRRFKSGPPDICPTQRATGRWSPRSAADIGRSEVPSVQDDSLGTRHSCGMGIRRAVPDVESERFEESRAFYVDVLGFEVGMEMDWVMTFVSPTNPTAQVILISEDASAPVAPQMSVEVDDVDAVHAEAMRHGVEIVHPLTDEPWGVRRFFARDPNGIIVNVLTH